MDYLTIKEAAQLKGCSIQYVQKQCKNGVLPAVIREHPQNHKPCYICTAIVGGMIRNGLSVRYMVWREASNVLKTALINGSYAAKISAYKKADVLYVDDLFKTSNTTEVSSADIRLAFEILDYRARNQMLTIISTEWVLSQLHQIDAAITGRIIQMSKGYAFEIRPDSKKDYRLRS